MSAARLPLALSAWSIAGRAVSPHRQRRIAGLLAARLLSSGAPYASAGGFTLAVDPGDPFQAAMTVGLYDRLLESVLARYCSPGATVIDAGAHIGYFTLRMARWVGPLGAVHSFEPDPRVLPRLERHVELNGAGWVTVNPMGVLDRSVAALDLTLPPQLGWSSVIPGAWGATESATVSMVSLDDYVRDRQLDPVLISLVKLDVEGAELAALRGAANLLDAGAPAVVIEHIPQRMRDMGQDPNEVTELMAGYGYEPYVPVPERRGFTLRPGAEPLVGDDVLFLARPGRRGPAATGGG